MVPCPWVVPSYPETYEQIIINMTKRRRRWWR